MLLSKALLIKVELQNMLYAKFIEAIAYPKWVSNLVIMPKLDGRIRIYTNFMDINKAYLKNNFPLPSIDIKIDNMVVHEIFFLMDDFFGYNQIMIIKEDKHKMLFTTPLGNILL